MTPDEHAARAVEIGDRAESWRDFDRYPLGDTERGERGQIDAMLALTHALLALRSAPMLAPPEMPDCLRVEDRDGDTLALTRANVQDVGSVAFLSMGVSSVLLDAYQARRVAAVLLRLAGDS